MNLSFFARNIRFVVIGLVILVVLIIVLAILTQATKYTPISPIQRIIPGRTTNSEIENGLNVKSKEASGSQTIYQLDSTNPIRPDQVITENNKAIFERINTPDSPSQPGFSKLDNFIQKYGSAEKVITGSKTYGASFETHIYAKRGFALVVNKFNQEVYEIQIFEPTSIQRYLAKFGGDIDPKVKLGD